MSGLGTYKKSKLSVEQMEVLTPLVVSCLNLNHDLNNPLAGIIGYCEFLLEDSDNLTEDQRNHLGQILTCSERMKALIGQLCRQKNGYLRQSRSLDPSVAGRIDDQL